jgi:NTP pyrophosphatase (non-canonical NTP hydrolase)
MGKDEQELEELKQILRRFAADRDWDQFHSPKNLSMALSVETAELLERFQWLTEEASHHPGTVDLAKIREEVADIFIYLIRIADKLDISLIDAAREKIRENEGKYPVEKSRGSSKKYTEL